MNEIVYQTESFDGNLKGDQKREKIKVESSKFYRKKLSNYNSKYQAFSSFQFFKIMVLKNLL
ncbi:hypothetical protein BpHYR1_016819 [Brachionus plicatilis]|uniref:Uncharacterized protein n=1 Tax=Brachionus plicatilis TaxID=10195 RepID=A0A3M7PW74_BRAPC|nr:hypothetical protein BpHYR1_016819 [Brachionus plicatilis]